MADVEKYVAKAGDTLWDIAEKYLGSGTKYKQLAAINDIVNPNVLCVGQTINLTNTSSTTTSPKKLSSKPTINQFGLQTNSNNTLFAAWKWDQSNTASYKVMWYYDTGDGMWFVGNNSSINVDADTPSASRQSTYNIPSNAKKVKFKVKPISKTHKVNNTETYYWQASWSNEKIYTDSTPLETPSVPSVTIDKYKLTAELSNVSIDATHIEFQVVKDEKTIYKTNQKASIVMSHVSYSCTVEAGGSYKVRCRAYKNKQYSEWSDYSSSVSSIPAAPSGITTCRATSETSVYLEWAKSSTADTYDIEYAKKVEYFDGSDQTTTVSGIEFNHYEKSGLESGEEYFFRVRAVNSDGASPWSGVVSIVIGKAPAAPTTWSSSTTVITGESLILYWVHNTEDGSSQTYADLELYINGEKESYTIKNSTEEDEKDKTSTYVVDTSSYTEGTNIQWRVRTAGITMTYGDWSIQRTIDVYAPPTLELSMTDIDGNAIEVLEAFPFYVKGLAGPNTQAPIGYHLAIVSNEIYETVDSVGNFKMVNAGEQVYSKYFDTSDPLLVELSAGNLDLENNISYTVTCTVSMNSGLTSESSLEFTVAWTDESYEPNAEIGINSESLTATIRPYCEDRVIENYIVSLESGVYTKTAEVAGSVYGELVDSAETTTGEQVYFGSNANGEEIYYCRVETATLVDDVKLSVYRREFDGSFTELASGLDNAKNTSITDPHPALDYARYRIVATTNSTGAVSYCDLPGYPVGEKSVIIQWDEEWTSFETSNEDEMEQPSWSGSLLRLPYNIDVSDKYGVDTTLVKYIGRKRPVSYYGTQLGESSSWKVAIDKEDTETLYALRRLAIWTGDVYVREPSGSGYWAAISVSFSQTHCEVTIPVSLEITRVEGGI